MAKTRMLLQGDIIEALKTLDEEYGIDVLGADIGGVESELKRIPTEKEVEEMRQFVSGHNSRRHSSQLLQVFVITAGDIRYNIPRKRC